VRARPPVEGFQQLCYDICVDCYPRANCSQPVIPYLNRSQHLRDSADAKLAASETSSHCCACLCDSEGKQEDTANGIMVGRSLHWCHSNFEAVIVACISINTCFMLSEHYQQSDQWTSLLEIQNWVFIGIFTVEFVVKVVGMSPQFYFTDPWNAFDFVVLLLSWPTAIMQHSRGSFLRMIRILRLARLVKRFDSLRAIANTLVFSLKPIGQVLIVLAMIFFCYAVIGQQLFGLTRAGNYLDSTRNFWSFGASLYTLFIMSTGEWVGFVKDLGVQPPLCTPDEDCGTEPWVAEIYGCTFIWVSQYMAWNVVVAVMLDRFACIYIAVYDPDPLVENIQVHAYHLRQFMALWDRFDMHFSGYLPNISSLLEAFFVRLGPPLGRNAEECRRFVQELQLEFGATKEKVHITTLFHAVVTRALMEEMNEDTAGSRNSQTNMKELREKTRETELLYNTKKLILLKELQALDQSEHRVYSSDRMLASSAAAWTPSPRMRRNSSAGKLLDNVGNGEDKCDGSSPSGSPRLSRDTAEDKELDGGSSPTKARRDLYLQHVNAAMLDGLDDADLLGSQLQDDEVNCPGTSETNLAPIIQPEEVQEEHISTVLKAIAASEARMIEKNEASHQTLLQKISLLAEVVQHQVQHQMQQDSATGNSVPGMPDFGRRNAN